MTSPNSIRSLAGAVTLAIAAATATLSTPVMAQQSNQTRPIIGVLNTQIIERDSLAHKGVRLERDKYVTRYQTEARVLETELREEEQRLTQQRNVLAPEVFQQQAQAFQEKFGTAQQESRIKLENLNAVVQQAAIQINQEMMGITSQVAQELGINMVMPQGVILLADPSMDITRPVLEILNERLPSVEMQNPEGGAVAAEGDAAAE
jgi:Skp family chaperone for outer membrane proteins